MKTGGCPKCGGDTYIEQDTYEVYEECIQCGCMFNRREKKSYHFKASAPEVPEVSEKRTAERAAREARNKEILRLANEGATYWGIGRLYNSIIKPSNRSSRWSG